MKNMIRQNLKFALAALSAMTIFTACELDETREETFSYTPIFNINVVYSDTTYHFTWNDEHYNSIKAQGGYVLLKDTVGTLRAYRGDELELDSAFHFTRGSTLHFIQLPGEKIKFYDSAATGGDEPDPADPTCVKARFVLSKYIDADSLRFIWMSSTKKNLSLPGSKFDIIDTTVVYKSTWSKYVELDTDRYAEGGNSTYFHYTRQTWDGSKWTGSSKTAAPNGFAAKGYRFVTFEITTSWQFHFLFGTAWE
jgi:hypothetical protein